MAGRKLYNQSWQLLLLRTLRFHSSSPAEWLLGALREQQNSERTLQIQLSRKRRPLTFYIRTLSFKSVPLTTALLLFRANVSVLPPPTQNHLSFSPSILQEVGGRTSTTTNHWRNSEAPRADERWGGEERNHPRWRELSAVMATSRAALQMNSVKGLSTVSFFRRFPEIATAFDRVRPVIR